MSLISRRIILYGERVVLTSAGGSGGVCIMIVGYRLTPTCQFYAFVVGAMHMFAGYQVVSNVGYTG